MAMFGDPMTFAIEAIVEPGPRFGPVQGTHVVGRLCVWLNGSRVGRFDEPACWLGTLLDHLRSKQVRLPTLWDPSLLELSADERFDRLDYLCFAARRGRSLADSWTEAEWAGRVTESEGFARFVFLLHGNEAFDGWKAFLLRPTTDTLQVLVTSEPQHTVAAHVVPVPAFHAAVDAFGAWLAEQERLLVPPERLRLALLTGMTRNATTSSCDFMVWRPGTSSDAAAARELYAALGAGDTTGVQPSPSIAAFYRELTTMHPERPTANDRATATPSNASESFPWDVDERDACPWAAAIEQSPGHLIVRCTWAAAEHAHGLFHRLAAAHGLAVFDPQNGVVT